MRYSIRSETSEDAQSCLSCVFVPYIRAFTINKYLYKLIIYHEKGVTAILLEFKCQIWFFFSVTGEVIFTCIIKTGDLQIQNIFRAKKATSSHLQRQPLLRYKTPYQVV